MYQPEMGQFAFGMPWAEFEVSDLGSACIASLLDEVRRVFWNRNGREVSFRDEGDAEVWNAYGSGIEWHAYWWGDEEAEEAARPNLTFAGLNIRWYKWPGRGESVEREMTPDDWSEWLTGALAAARTADTRL